MEAVSVVYSRSAEDVKEFADVDAQGLKAIGEGLQGIANFIQKMDGAHVKRVPTAYRTYKTIR